MSNPKIILAWVSVYLNFLLIIPCCYAQLISIDEYLNSAMADKQIELTYSENIEGVYYSTVLSDKYIAITEASLLAKTFEKYETHSFQIPEDIHILSSSNKQLNLKIDSSNFKVTGFFTSDGEDYFIHSKLFNNKHRANICNMRGEHIRALNCPPEVRCSPSGKYFYLKRETSALPVYDEIGNKKFYIECLGDYVAEPVNDSMLLVLDAKYLSLWNINTEQEIWKIEVPFSTFKVIGRSVIKHSVKNNLIVFNDWDECFAFDFLGKFLWRLEFDDKKDAMLLMIGINENSKELVTIKRDYNVRNLVASFFDCNGSLKNELNLQVNSSEGSYIAWNTNLLVYDNYLIAPLLSTDWSNPEYVTSIISLTKQDPEVFNVEGFWYPLTDNNDNMAFVGVTSVGNSIRVYRVMND